MKKFTESLNIAKWSRKGHLSIWYRLPCTFLYGAAYKNLSPFHTSGCNHELWRRLCLLTLLPIEVWIDSDSLADRKISSVFILPVLRIVCLKMSIFGVKRASDERFCPRTVLYGGESILYDLGNAGLELKRYWGYWANRRARRRQVCHRLNIYPEAVVVWRAQGNPH